MNKIIIIIAALLLNACSTKHTPENTTAAGYNVQLGLGYLEKGDTARAKEKLLRATDQAPDFIDAHLALAYYYENIGQLDFAQKTYQEALKMMPKSGQVNNNYGAFLCSHGHYEQSMVYFQRAIEDVYYNQTASAYENAALCSAKMNDTEAAQRYAHLAVAQDASKQDIFIKLSYLLEQNAI
ncbi:MAG: type IV pilus biogenesis/stability protein PilW [Legionellales bacterium]